MDVKIKGIKTFYITALTLKEVICLSNVRLYPACERRLFLYFNLHVLVWAEVEDYCIMGQRSEATVDRSFVAYLVDDALFAFICVPRLSSNSPFNRYFRDGQVEIRAYA